MWTGTNGIQLAIASCPQDKETCPGNKLVQLANKAASPTKLSFEFKANNRDSCAYILEAICDSPGFFLSDTATALNDNGIAFSIIDYDLTFNANSAETPTKFKNGIFTEVGKFLKQDQSIKVNDDPYFKYYQGELGTVDIKILNDKVRPTPGTLIYQEILRKQAVYDKFSVDKAAWESKRIVYEAKVSAMTALKTELALDVLRELFPTPEEALVLDVGERPTGKPLQ